MAVGLTTLSGGRGVSRSDRLDGAALVELRNTYT
jgi:hypothetical protein